MVTTTIEMTPTQQQWINDTTRELLVEGSAGSGKTLFACFKVIFYALNYPEASIYVYRKTLPSLKRTAWKEIRNILQSLKGGVKSNGEDLSLYDTCHENKSEGTITFPNGSVMYFGALDELSKVRSINGDLIYIEQGEELVDTEFYTELMLRLGRGKASKRKGGFSQMILVVQPESEEHWIYKRYHEYIDATTKYERQKQESIANGTPVQSYDEILSEIKSRRKRAFFHYSENLKLPKFQRDYYDDLKYEDYELWLRYSAGKWGKLSNVIYPNYDHVLHSHYDFYSFGIDFGYNNPSCFLLLGWYDNEVNVIDEVYERKLTTQEFIGKVNEMLFNNNLLPEQLHTGFGDAAEPDRIEEFYQAGYPIEPGVKDVSAKINSTKQTKIHIHPQCVNTIKEIKSYIYKKDKNGVVTDIPVKVHDHAMDALGYGVYGVRGYLSPHQPRFNRDYEYNIMVF